MREYLVPLLVIAAVPGAYGADDAPLTYSDAQASWEMHKDSKEYQSYMSEFVQFNNHFHLDERGGCYALGREQVRLMLVVTHAVGSEFATIESAFSDADSPKVRCFVKSYVGVKTKVPPYLPFVIQMTMG